MYQGRGATDKCRSLRAGRPMFATSKLLAL